MLWMRSRRARAAIPPDFRFARKFAGSRSVILFVLGALRMSSSKGSGKTAGLVARDFFEHGNEN